MCRDKSHGGRRCACDSSAARQARRHRATAAASDDAAAVQATLRQGDGQDALGDEGVPGEPDAAPLSDEEVREGLVADAEDLRSRVGALEPEYARGVATYETMEEVQDLEAEVSGLGERTDVWIESQEDVVAAREEYEAARARFEEAAAERERLRQEFVAMGLRPEREKFVEVTTAMAQAAAVYSEVGKSVNMAASTLGERRLAHFGRLRAMGGEATFTDHRGGRPTKRVREAMADTTRFFPSDWVDSSNRLNESHPLTVRRSKARAHYQHGAVGVARGYRAGAAPYSFTEFTPGSDQGFYETTVDGSSPEGQALKAAGVRGYPVNGRQGLTYDVEYVRAGFTREMSPTWDAYKANRRANSRPTYSRVALVDDDGHLTEAGRAEGWTETTLPDGTRGAIRDAHAGDQAVVASGSTLTSPFDSSQADNTSIHEMTHRMEYANPRLPLLERAYLTRRSGTDPRSARLIPLASGRRERALGGSGLYQDYAARVYSNDSAYEVASMGTPLAWGRMRTYTDAPTLPSHEEFTGMDDTSHRTFIYGAMLAV